MLPVHQYTRRTKNTGHVHKRVFDADTSMRSTSEHKVIFGVAPGRTCRIEPSFRGKLGGIREHFRVVAGGVQGRYHHAIRWYCVCG